MIEEFNEIRGEVSREYHGYKLELSYTAKVAERDFFGKNWVEVRCNYWVNGVMVHTEYNHYNENLSEGSARDNSERFLYLNCQKIVDYYTLFGTR